MNIMTNLNALNAARHQGIHSANFKKSTEKLSSGYKINRSADGAAELNISEGMRAQIRGLNRSVTNAEEGANFIQTGDGSMNEIHAMLQRMRELSVQSLNDTNTQADRAALAAEFNELQSEIDRISKGTYFNTQPVFQEHEASYYQIAGNRKWEASQQHIISAPDNSLTIHLPSDLYAPPEDVYTIQVPDGIYTTQELIDEIEDAFMEMTAPAPNPGFVLEYTDDGYCNLNFENADGEPTKIDTVDGPLSYLIYDSFSGNSSANLLGTTIFDPIVNIKKDINDELGFTVVRLDGSSDDVTLKIPPKNYDRQTMIDELNSQLKAKGYPDIIATEYGSKSIQIIGGPSVSITGLKGNMFTIETGSDIYTSVFYDNICPGAATDSFAKFYGAAHFNSYTQNIKITDENNHLKFKIGNDEFDYEFLPDERKEYTVSQMKDKLNEIFEKFACPVTADLNGDTLMLTGTKNGKGLEFNFTDYFDPQQPAIKKTYDTLFCITNYDYSTPPETDWGADVTPPSPAVPPTLTGNPVLPAEITLPDGTNTVDIIINGTSYGLTIPGGKYTQNALEQALKDQLPADLKDKIDIQFVNNRIVIKGKTDDIISIGVGRSEADRILFATSGTIPNGAGSYPGYGYEKHTIPQGGGTPIVEFVPATVTIGADIQETIAIKQNANTLSFSLNGTTVNLPLTPKDNYSREDLIAEINTQLKLKNLTPNVTASLSGNRLTLTTEPTGNDGTYSLYVSIPYSTGSIWDSIVGTRATSPNFPNTANQKPPSPEQPAKPSVVTSEHQFNQITIGDPNNVFSFSYNGNTYNIPLQNGDYDPNSLAAHLQTQINTELGITGVTVTYANRPDEGLVITAGTPGEKYYTLVENGFYKTVLKKPVTNSVTGNPSPSPSDHTYTDPYIIGREDLKINNVTFEKGLNDTFTIDLHYQPTPPTDSAKNPKYDLPLTVTFPPGEMTGDQIAAYMQDAFNKQLAAKGLKAEVRIGTDHSISIVGAIKDALQISIKEDTANGANAPAGTYILDSARGNAAYFIFYRTTSKPAATYITGTHDISDGVVFEPGKNGLSFKLDGVEYSYEFPVGTKYTAQEFIDLLNDDFENGTLNGKPAPVRASLENGNLRLTYQDFGPHTITEVKGSGKGTVFFHEEGREYQDPYMLQVGSLGHQGLELTRLRVNTASLGINSVTITRPKYANKALDRLDHAIDKLSERRSLYGALQNRIEFLTSNNRNTSQNLQASESRIRDTNMAAEMIEHAKNMITTQASEAVLAQANQVPSTVLVMLQQD